MKKIIYTTLTFLWIGFIFYNSLKTGEQSSEFSSRFVNMANIVLKLLNIYIDKDLLSFLIRKFAHIFEFFILAILSYSMFKQYIKKYNIYIVFGFGLLIAFIDECLQLFSKGRHASIRDVFIDTIGTILGVGIIYIVNVINCKKKSKTMLNIK